MSFAIPKQFSNCHCLFSKRFSPMLYPLDDFQRRYACIYTHSTINYLLQRSKSHSFNKPTDSGYLIGEKPCQILYNRGQSSIHSERSIVDVLALHTPTVALHFFAWKRSALRLRGLVLFVSCWRQPSRRPCSHASRRSAPASLATRVAGFLRVPVHARAWYTPTSSACSQQPD